MKCLLFNAFPAARKTITLNNRAWNGFARFYRWWTVRPAVRCIVRTSWSPCEAVVKQVDNLLTVADKRETLIDQICLQVHMPGVVNHGAEGSIVGGSPLESTNKPNCRSALPKVQVQDLAEDGKCGEGCQKDAHRQRLTATAVCLLTICLQ